MPPQAAKIIGFKQLLNLAHERGLVSIETEPLKVEADWAFFRATVTLMVDGEKRAFTGHADAAKNNVGPAMVHCIPRMSETRAIVRALRLAVNVGEVAAEELSDYQEVAPVRAGTPRASQGLQTEQPMLNTQEGAIKNLCKQQGKEIPDMAGWTQGQAAEYLRTLQQKQAA